MSSILLSLPELYNTYKSWVSSHPQTASDYETTAKWISYVIAGRINNSHAVSELVYCLSNLLVLYNDRVIKSVLHLEVTSTGDRLKLWLTIMEYSEVFCELSAKKLWGTTGKWIVVVAIQFFKCISRLFLVYHHKEIIIQSPPIPALDRSRLPKGDQVFFQQDGSIASVSFKLKRTGRVIRRVDGAPPVAFRDWKPLDHRYCDDRQLTVFKKQQQLAETIYALKPAAHLATMAYFGEKTWKPWLVALTLDLVSMEIYKSIGRKCPEHLTPQQKIQMSKRTLALVLYLIRSPCYDRHSKDKLNSFLMGLSKYVPLAGLICNPLAQYLPFWQSTYFYMWST